MHRKVINQKYLQPLLDFFNDTVFRYLRVIFYDFIIPLFIPFHCKQELDIYWRNFDKKFKNCL